MIKQLFILISLTIITIAAPMPEAKALSLFAKIKKSEYNWVLAQWENEMRIKVRSRSSSRRPVWAKKDQWKYPFDKKKHDPVREIRDPSTITIPPVDPITVPDI
ncbi:MAG: hypothetical protein HF962_07795 [Sulfurovum sp.]|nr:hypothetical protein [Sulfurovum sp.]